MKRKTAAKISDALDDLNDRLPDELQVGVEISFPKPGGCGGRDELYLDANDLVEVAADPWGWLGARHGVTGEEYRRWCEAHGEPRCGATTKAGTSCKLQPVGAAWVDGYQGGLHQFLRFDGELCHIHGGRAAKRTAKAATRRPAAARLH